MVDLLLRSLYKAVLTKDLKFVIHYAYYNLADSSQTIGAALKDCVGIPVKEFALIAIHENGDVKTYSSPALNPARHKIFSDAFKSTFSKAVRRVGSEASSQSQGK